MAGGAGWRRRADEEGSEGGGVAWGRRGQGSGRGSGCGGRAGEREPWVSVEAGDGGCGWREVTWGWVEESGNEGGEGPKGLGRRVRGVEIGGGV